jgi:hypothetical protein
LDCVLAFFSEALPVFCLIELEGRIDYGIDSGRASPPGLAVHPDLFIKFHLVVPVAHFVQFPQKLLRFLQKVIGLFGFAERYVLIGIVVYEHFDESAMVEEVDFTLSEVEFVELVGSVLEEEIFVDADGVVCEEGVGDLLGEEMFAPAELDDTVEDVAIEVDYL